MGTLDTWGCLHTGWWRAYLSVQQPVTWAILHEFTANACVWCVLDARACWKCTTTATPIVVPCSTGIASGAPFFKPKLKYKVKLFATAMTKIDLIALIAAILAAEASELALEGPYANDPTLASFTGYERWKAVLNVFNHGDVYSRYQKTIVCDTSVWARRYFMILLSFLLENLLQRFVLSFKQRSNKWLVYCVISLFPFWTAVTNTMTYTSYHKVIANEYWAPHEKKLMAMPIPWQRTYHQVDVTT